MDNLKCATEVQSYKILRLIFCVSVVMYCVHRISPVPGSSANYGSKNDKTAKSSSLDTDMKSRVCATLTAQKLRGSAARARLNTGDYFE